MAVYFPLWDLPANLKEIKEFFEKVDRWTASNGKVWTADRCKSARLIVTRAFCGSPLNAPFGQSVSKAGVPNLIPRFLHQPLLDRDPKAFRLTLSLLTVSRGFLGGKPISLKDIESPSTEDFSVDLSWSISEMRSRLRVKGWSPSWVSFHWTAKMGPNGPALAYSLLEAGLLPAALRDAIATLAGPSISRMIRKLSALPSPALAALKKAAGLKEDPSILRRISIKPDRECKERPFAMLDYFSQTALRPLHEMLFDNLRKIPQDRTFIQGDQFRLRPPNGHKYYSFDLSAATDRFPIRVQKQVLGILIGPERAEAWAHIMVGYPFAYAGRNVSYACGQPMGAYSSWALFALSHHAVVWEACRRSGVDPVSAPYILLGDDIVIAHDDIAEHYKALCHSLGVEISPTKTHVSVDTCEFAKRWFHRGMEITPFPLHGVIENRKSFHALYETLRQSSKRGYCLPTPWQPSLFFPRLLEALGHKGRIVPYLSRRIQMVHLLPIERVSTWELAQRALNFTHVSGAKWIGSLDEEAIDFAFSLAAGRAWETMLRREREKLTRGVEGLEIQFSHSLEPVLSGLDDQSTLEELIHILPPVAALVERAQTAAEGLGVDSAEAIDEGNLVPIWDKADLIDYTPMPKLNGIAPMRASLRRALARSHWALEVSRVLGTPEFRGVVSD